MLRRIAFALLCGVMITGSASAQITSVVKVELASTLKVNTDEFQLLLTIYPGDAEGVHLGLVQLKKRVAGEFVRIDDGSTAGVAIDVKRISTNGVVPAFYEIKGDVSLKAPVGSEEFNVYAVLIQDSQVTPGGSPSSGKLKGKFVNACARKSLNLNPSTSTTPGSGVPTTPGTGSTTAALTYDPCAEDPDDLSVTINP